MRIPIDNIYYLLCYAWGHADHVDTVESGLLRGVSSVQDLLGIVLAQGTFQAIKRGVDRGYIEYRDDLVGVRGKIEPSEMVKRAVRSRGRVSCVFQELDLDILLNQIIRSTLHDLLLLPELDAKIRGDVRSAYQKLHGISIIHLNREIFRRVQLDASRRHYHFLINICELVHQQILPDAEGGGTRFRDFREDEHRMWKLFEDFVLEFLRREQSEYAVNPSGRRIKWFDASGATAEDLSWVPQMEADVILESRHRRIVIDTKFYSHSFQRFGESKKVHSGNLYQLLAYLRNRHESYPTGPRHEGILLYPVVDEPISVDVRLEGFRIQARGIDLGRPWQSIHDEMLWIVSPSATSA